MNISYNRIELSITQQEAVTIYYALKRDIERAIKSHWVNHPHAYCQHELPALDMMRTLAPFTNSVFAYDEAELKKGLDDLVAAKIKVVQ